jgi:hypothetical protein
VIQWTLKKSHVPGAINIYVGRLPYVSKKELDINDVIINVSSSEYNIKKAVRTLMKSGFYNFAGSLWIENESGIVKRADSMNFVFK